MRTIFSVLLLLLLLATAMPAIAQAPAPAGVAGLSANGLPDLSKLGVPKEVPDIFGGIQRVYSVPGAEGSIVVTITRSLPWNHDQVMVWEWRVPDGQEGWRYFSAFDAGTITEYPRRRTPLLEPVVVSITVTLPDQGGNPDKTRRKVFTRPATK